MPDPSPRSAAPAFVPPAGEPKPVTTAATKPAAKPDKKAGARDPVREALETVVFVVVLVFLLKQFVVEAFVIPTGSMAETLYGYHKILDCPECGQRFPLNCSSEVDPQEGQPRVVAGYCCPNCRFRHEFTPDERRAGRVPGYTSGDRVLVNKWEYHAFGPTRGDVVVFKFPQKPQTQMSAQNYIKRMWGLGGDTIAIWRGDLYVTQDLRYPEDARGEDGSLLYPRPERPEDAWQGDGRLGADYRYPSTAAAVELFEKSKAAGFPEDQPGFRLIRKTDAQLAEMMRLVYDNDHQARTLVEKGVPPRWGPAAAGDGWAADAPTAAKSFTHTGPALGWLRYRHLVADQWDELGKDPKPGVVDNFLGYNGESQFNEHTGRWQFVLGAAGYEDQRFWVGDLVVECVAKITDPAAEVVLELGKGPNRYQAKFAGGQVSLTRTGPLGPGEKADLGSRPTKVTTGAYTLRFANVDGRLRVWVDGRRIDFGTAADYAPRVPATFHPDDAKHEGWTEADRAEPVKVGAAGAVAVSRLKVWRDTYFINQSFAATADAAATVNTFYVQPGHYLCLGDNSAQSSDGRMWGTVPERLMLGRAAFVFFPLDRIGFIK
jgi:signal peptidase I